MPKEMLSRREFIKGAATVGTAVATAGVLGPLTAAEAVAAGVPEKWDKEADVVVVGYGGAGAASAITASDAGAKVLLLEKNPKGKEGGNTRVSGQVVLSPLPEMQSQFLQYLNGNDVWNQVPDAVKQAAAAEFVKNEEWLKFIGGNPKGMQASPETDVPGKESVRYASAPGGFGSETWWKVIAKAVVDRPIEVLYETPGKRLVRNDSGEIVGVIAASGDKEIAIKAKRGVILTTGGFEFNDQMQKDYAPAYPINYFGNPANTGDGIRMAQAVGADLWHMNNCMGGLAGGLRVPPYQGLVWTSWTINGLYVDKYGKRFMNEGKPHAHGWGWRELLYFDHERMTYPRIPWYAIFDEKTRAKVSLLIPGFRMAWAMIIEGLEWSKDNSAEVEKGWILKGNTIEELAAKIAVQKANDSKMKADVLAASLKRYNGFCKTGTDDDFGRAKDSLVAQDTGPFYAMELWPTSVNTQGGPRRDEKGRIIDVEGKPIPRLYSAGELGSIWASLYQGGGNVGETMVFGRISGRNAAAEKPWDAKA